MYDRTGPGGLRELRIDPPEAEARLLETSGRMPLPPYIKRAGSDPAADALDRERYQTIFASEPGAVAAPTAGLHFTRRVVEAIESAGGRFTGVTLHVGMGTFKPITAEDLAGHVMHAESYAIGPETARAVRRTRDDGGRVIAVGTTTCRVLEAVAAERGAVEPAAGSTDLFITPGFEFKVTDALVTNFHLPGSTLIVLVSAFAGRRRVLDAYRQAVARRYRFYSYGDVMFIC